MKRLLSSMAAAWFGLTMSGTAYAADTWTNVAGHVITAKLVALEGERVLLQLTNGRIQRVPLSTLKPADRERAREQTGTELLPMDLKILFEQAREDLDRAAQFLHGGNIGREQYTERCHTICLRFEHLGRLALAKRGAPTKSLLLERLKDRLDRLPGGSNASD